MTKVSVLGEICSILYDVFKSVSREKGLNCPKPCTGGWMGSQMVKSLNKWKWLCTGKKRAQNFYFFQKVGVLFYENLDPSWGGEGSDCFQRRSRTPWALTPRFCRLAHTILIAMSPTLKSTSLSVGEKYKQKQEPLQERYLSFRR